MSHESPPPDTPRVPGGIIFRSPAPNAPTTLLAEAEVPVEHGPLAGLTIAGIRVWRDAGQLFVTFPVRPTPDRPWEHIRPSDGRRSTVDAAKGRILAAWAAFTADKADASLAAATSARKDEPHSPTARFEGADGGPRGKGTPARGGTRPAGVGHPPPELTG